MKIDFTEIIRCPQCSNRMTLSILEKKGEEVASGSFQCQSCEKIYPIITSIPRFVESKNYASNFGFQWNLFAKTQLDSHSGLSISRERFFKYTGWTPDILHGKLVLDVGCGAGRFAEIALSCGAIVVAIDFSTAIDACFSNLGNSSNLFAVQADVYKLPFATKAFDYVYCLGVLQHTPDPKNAFFSLGKQLREGGKLAVDIYPKIAGNIFWPKYWLRPLTKRIAPEFLFRLVQFLVPILMPISSLVNRIPKIGRMLKYLIPVVNYQGVYPLSKKQLSEWAILDTFDMFGPSYDQPQSSKTLHSWLSEAKFADIEVLRSGFLIGRGTKT